MSFCTRSCLLSLLLSFCVVSIVFADTFEPDTNYQVCFTPGQNCTGIVTNAVNHAKRTILVQAYSFTSVPIAKALVNAKRRGVSIKIILDKTQFESGNYSSAPYFLNAGIPLWDDKQVSIAHNKVMIIDDSTVITGSFNFTRAAQMHNAENLIMIHSRHLAAVYTQNWFRRQQYASVAEHADATYKYSNDENNWKSSSFWSQLLRWLEKRILKELF